jgi:hypothetical protein
LPCSSSNNKTKAKKNNPVIIQIPRKESTVSKERPLMMWRQSSRKNKNQMRKKKSQKALAIKSSKVSETKSKLATHIKMMIHQKIRISLELNSHQDSQRKDKNHKRISKVLKYWI